MPEPFAEELKKSRHNPEFPTTDGSTPEFISFVRKLNKHTIPV
jgi:hypothetical protein